MITKNYNFQLFPYHINKNMYNIKVILGELTPRTDERDEEVIICNEMINDFARINKYVYLAKHSNLRDPNNTFIHEVKHVKKMRIARFAANLKRALRAAYDIKLPGNDSKATAKTQRQLYPVQQNFPHTNWNNRNNFETNLDRYYFHPVQPTKAPLICQEQPRPWPPENYHNAHPGPANTIPESQFETFKNELKKQLIAILS